MKYLIYRVTDDDPGNAIGEGPANELVGVEFGGEIQEVINEVIWDIRADVEGMSFYHGGAIDVYGPESEEFDSDRGVVYYEMTAAIKPVGTADTTLVKYLVMELEG